jgi:hypothetical protein
MDKTKKLEILQKLISLANNNPNDNEANSAARRACKLIVELNINFKVRNSSNQNQSNQNQYNPPKPNPSTQSPWNHPPYDYGPTYQDFDDLFSNLFGRRPKTASQYDEEAKRKGEEARKRAQEQAETEQRKEEQRKKNEEFRQKYEQHKANYNNEKWYYQRPPNEVKIPKDYKVNVESDRKWDIPFHFDFDPGDFVEQKKSEPKFAQKVTWTETEVSNMTSAEFREFKKRNDIDYDPSSRLYTLKKKLKTCTECGKENLTGYIGNIYVCTECQWKQYRERAESK